LVDQKKKNLSLGQPRIILFFLVLTVWAVPGRFFQSLPVPCGASPDVTSPDVTDSREKKN
jgi:hypothetical protein